LVLSNGLLVAVRTNAVFLTLVSVGGIAVKSSSEAFIVVGLLGLKVATLRSPTLRLDPDA